MVVFSDNLSYFCKIAERRVRNSFLYKNYFDDFFSKQKPKVKEKIVWTINLVETLEIVPDEYFKHLTNTNGL